MSNLRTCEFSSQLFGGFRFTFDITIVDCIDDIIALAVSHLFHVLTKYNLTILIEKANSKYWHIHSRSFEDIVINDNTVWICDHC